MDLIVAAADGAGMPARKTGAKTLPPSHNGVGADYAPHNKKPKKSKPIPAKAVGGYFIRRHADPDFEKFCKLGTMENLIAGTRGDMRKNVRGRTLASTQRLYAYSLWKLDVWLRGREIEYKMFVGDGDAYRKKTIRVRLAGLEDMLEKYREAGQSQREFLFLIKKYLNDPIHGAVAASTIKSRANAIKKYFATNETEFILRYDAKVKYGVDSPKEVMLTLNDFFRLLTQGRPNLLQKAAFLCKFQRGLDSSTLYDRFNYEAYDQLCRYFKGEDHTKWDVTLCPVPVILTRLKTDFKHTGFLDVDAVSALKEYLTYREGIVGRPIQSGEPMFITTFRTPIRNSWVSEQFRNLAKRAGMSIEANSHEFRDLLESTLIDAGCRADVAEHCIGHVPPSSYQKQAKLYPDTLRTEYAKASGRINPFVKFERMTRGTDNVDAVRGELREKISEMTDMQKSALDAEAERVRTQQAMAEQQRRLELIEARLSVREFVCQKCNARHGGGVCPECGSDVMRLVRGSSGKK